MSKILFVSMPGVTHAAQWISQLKNTGWEIHFFPSHDGAGYLDVFEGITAYSKEKIIFHKDKNIINRSISPTSNYRINRFLQKVFPSHFDSTQWLAKVIDTIQPDLIHSMEMQRGAYLVDQAKKYVKKKFPKWIVTPWGSDLYLYKNLSSHVDKLKSVLSHCDYFWAECQRDFQYAKELGFNGKMLEAVPASGGYPISLYQSLNHTPPSKRKYILLKGYQGFAGRAINALTALKECVKEIQGYTLVIYLSSYDVDVAAELFAKSTGIEVKTLRFPRPYEEIQSYFSKSRIHIGLSISDGLPTTVIESMAMGTFPIQSDSSCAHEWIRNGENGLLVSADDPHQIAMAIKRALSEDQLVDHASNVNLQILKEKMEYEFIQNKVLNIYESIFSKNS